ncbi:unnamed protein product [Paramecium pentaurelia]|uniref:Uncharacterized protein n=1 Tax=Paramecium pentaurelia TaxID=43138 RepID=A0A8S1TRK6_9CILI|nr:unnamed protein product [Paramecium pentaurelia]
MTHYSKHDPSGQWSRLIERQKIQQEMQEKQEKEEQENRKRLYREELERLINEQKQSTIQKTKYDSEFAGAMQKFLHQRDSVEQLKLQELKQKQSEFIRYSLEQEQIKKEQQRLNFLQDRQQQFQIGIMMDQAEKKDIYLKQQKKEQVQKDLAQSYLQQEEQKKMDQYLSRQREQQLLQEQLQRSQKEEEQRLLHLSTIKYGYHQNENVLQKYNDLYLQKEYKDKELQRKFIEEAATYKQRQEEEKYIMERVNKEKLQKDTVDTILNQIHSKQQSQREQQNSKYKDQEVLLGLHQKFQMQEREQSERKNQLQQQYRQDLIIKHDPSGQWSRLIERQKIQQEMQEKQEKEEQENRKRLYREELERLINEQKQSTIQKTKYDSEFAGAMQKFLHQRDSVEQLKLQELKQKQSEFIRYSLEQEQIKKEQQRLNFLQDRQQQFQIGIMMDQAEKKDIYLKQQKKEQVQKDLAQSYLQQEEQKKMDQYLSRQREQQLLQEQLQRSQKEEEQRLLHLSTIKYGYHQNENVLQKYNDLYLQKEYKDKELQRKFIEEAATYKQRQEEEKYIMERVNKEKLQKDTVDTILNQIHSKQQSQREQQNSKYKDQEVLLGLHQKFQMQEREQSERKNQLQQQYRQDLIMQIEEDKNRKQQEASMSMVELNMNKKIFEAEDDPQLAGIGVVPGLSNHVDYEKLKQKAYVDGTFKKSAEQQMQFKRLRNVSAYIAGNNVTQNYGY